MDTKDRILMKPNAASQVVIDRALRVHTALGAGILESAVRARVLAS
jgi:hypothetical protein